VGDDEVEPDIRPERLTVDVMDGETRAVNVSCGDEVPLKHRLGLEDPERLKVALTVGDTVSVPEALSLGVRLRRVDGELARLGDGRSDALPEGVGVKKREGVAGGEFVSGGDVDGLPERAEDRLEATLALTLSVLLLAVDGVATPLREG
jgi:hypothetical protein